MNTASKTIKLNKLTKLLSIYLILSIKIFILLKKLFSHASKQLIFRQLIHHLKQTLFCFPQLVLIMELIWNFLVLLIHAIYYPKKLYLFYKVMDHSTFWDTYFQLLK